MKNSRKTAVLWTASALWMALIFIMSAAPGDVSSEQSGFIIQLLTVCMPQEVAANEQLMPALETLVRKGAHMTEFAVLFLLLRASLRSSGVRRAERAAMLITVVYAASDEFHQAFVPGRWPSVIDVCIDGCGALIAWGAAVIIRSCRRIRDQAAER